MSLLTAVLSEGKYLGDWLKYEQDNHYSRDMVTVLAGSGSDRVLTSGMVLAKVVTGAGSSAAATNTGNGVMGAITVGADAKAGVYTLVVIEPGSNAGKFVVEDPDGIVVGEGTVAVAFTGGGISFTLADGSTDFASGDSFAITVAAGSLKYVQIDFAGTAGQDAAAGILLLNTTAVDGSDAAGVIIARGALVSANGITWPVGATTNQKNAAIAQLKTLGIIVREGA